MRDAERLGNMRISIGNIKIHAITTIGSLNIGTTVLCQNRAVYDVSSGGGEAETGGGEPGSGTGEYSNPIEANGGTTSEHLPSTPSTPSS